MNDNLPPPIAELAAIAGLQRRLRSRHGGKPDRLFGWDTPANDPAGWSTDIQGAIGEWMVARELGLWPQGIDPELMHAGDLPGIEVRARTQINHDLLVRPNDPDGRAYVLVVGIWPKCRIVGWISAGEAKQECYWNSALPAPAYCIPQPMLRPLYQLGDELDRLAR